MTTGEKQHLHTRIVILGALFGVFLSAIAVRAAYIQIIKAEWLSEKAERQYRKSDIRNGRRGTIFDRRGRKLAVSIDVTSIAAHPAMIESPSETARALSRILGQSRKTIECRLKSGKTFVWIKRKATPQETEAVKSLHIAGLSYIPEHNRFYPNKTLAAQVLGFTGIDESGLEGIEYACNDILKGASEKITFQKDALGRKIIPETAPPQNTSGGNIVLTIDRTIQFITEKALKDAVIKYGAKSGIAVVMDPNTGEMLSIAHYPFFNPNTYRDYKQEDRRNRAITDSFEPGSTLKIFLAAGAIESGMCNPGTIFFCENGEYRIGPNTVHDTKPHEWLSLQQIIKHSSNIGAVKISEMTGDDLLYSTLIDFGFNRETDIDCPGETCGSLLPPDRWTRIDAGAISFGQGMAASATQLITAASAIANGGALMRPYIVKSVLDADGNTVKNFQPVASKRVISEDTARTVRRIMKTVVTEGGTGTEAAPAGYTVCGKTGTAQKTDDTGRYAKGKYIASFLGFAPVENPEIAVLVMVDEPEEKNHYGGTVAAPAFRTIVSETLNYMNAYPEVSKNLTASISDRREE